MLTAAHVVDDFGSRDFDTDAFTVKIGTDAYGFDYQVTSQHVSFLSGYTVITQTNGDEIAYDDLAIITLDSPVNMPGLPTPEEYKGDNLYSGGISSGQYAVALGYDVEAGVDVRKSGPVEIDSIYDDRIVCYQDNSWEVVVEGGNSGGPTFIRDNDGQYKIAGIHSSSDDGYMSTDMRVSHYSAWIHWAVKNTVDTAGPDIQMTPPQQSGNVIEFTVQYSDPSQIQSTYVQFIQDQGGVLNTVPVLHPVSHQQVDESTWVAKYQYQLSSYDTYMIQITAQDGLGNVNQRTTVPFTPFRPVDFQINGDTGGQVIAGDSELHTDDWTEVQITSTLETDGRSIWLNIVMYTYEKTDDKRYQDTVIQLSGRVEIYRLPEGSNQFIEGFKNSSELTYWNHVYGEQHSWIDLGNQGMIGNLSIRIDHSGDNDHLVQAVRGTLMLDPNNVIFGSLSTNAPSATMSGISSGETLNNLSSDEDQDWWIF